MRETYKRLYQDIKPPQNLPDRVLLRIEKHKERRLKLILIVQSVVFFLLLSYGIYRELLPKEYATMSANAVRVLPAEKSDLRELAKELKERGLVLQGPYEGGVFLLVGKDAMEYARNSRFLKLAP